MSRGTVRVTPDRQFDLPFERRGARSLGEATGEGDLGVVLDVEEVGAA
jgi:hypothetical protein